MINTRVSFFKLKTHKTLSYSQLLTPPFLSDLIYFDKFFNNFRVKFTKKIKKNIILWEFFHKFIFFNLLRLKYFGVKKKYNNFTKFYFKFSLKINSFFPAQSLSQMSLYLMIWVSTGSLQTLKLFLITYFTTIPLYFHTNAGWNLRKFFSTLFIKHNHVNFNKKHMFFKIKIRGKFGVAGNSRRRQFTYTYGKKSLPKNPSFLKNKEKKIFFLIPTFTGVLGVSVFYKK